MEAPGATQEPLGRTESIEALMAGTQPSEEINVSFIS
jgi:hypothetical protein